jgi:hypothetical protein
LSPARTDPLINDRLLQRRPRRSCHRAPRCRGAPNRPARWPHPRIPPGRRTMDGQATADRGFERYRHGYG